MIASVSGGAGLVRRVRGGVRLASCVALTVLAGAAWTGNASARTGSGHLRAAVPQAALAGTNVQVSGTVGAGTDRVALQQQLGRAWKVIAYGAPIRGGRRGAFRLSWRTPSRVGRMRVRVLGLHGARVTERTRTFPVTVSGGHFRPGLQAVVLAHPKVTSVPAPGESGVVVFSATRAKSARTSAAPVPGRALVIGSPTSIQPGQVFALPYNSVDTPLGFLGRALAIDTVGAITTIQTAPATLLDAGVQGDISPLREKVPADFEPAIDSRSVRCSDGASATVAGRVKVSIKPQLHANFSLLPPRLNSADFSLTATASGSLHAETQATAGCQFTAQVPKAPAQLGTFEAAIGGIPIVVVLQGQLTLTGSFTESAGVSVEVTPSVSASGGLSYTKQNGFKKIVPYPVAAFPFSLPDFHATGHAEATVEPRLSMLLYGVAGPELGLKAGLDLAADTAANPWWSLTAPVDIDATLTASVLGIRKTSGKWNIYHHVFPVSQASGPFGNPTGPTGPSGPTGPTGPLPQPLGPTIPVIAPPVPGALWTVGVPEGGARAIETPLGNVVASTCPSSNDLATAPIVQMLSPSGATAWSAPLNVDGESWGCPDGVADADGNYYFATVVSLTAGQSPVFELLSVDPTGRVRWAVPSPAPPNSQSPPVLGADGSVYFDLFAPHSGDVIYGYDTSTGAETLHAKYFSWLQRLYAYPGGLIAVNNIGPTTIDYLDFSGNVQHEVTSDVSVSQNSGSYTSFAYGGGGTVFMAGYASDAAMLCAPGRSQALSVEKITPTGKAWTWSDPDLRSCSSTGLASSPDGGVVISRAPDAATSAEDFTSLGPTGALRWAHSGPGPLGTSSYRISQLNPRVDANGIAVLPSNFLYSCHNDTATCAGSRVEFLTQDTGAQAFPDLVVQDPATDYYYLNDVAIGANRVFLSRWGNGVMSVAAFASPGLAAGFGRHSPVP